MASTRLSLPHELNKQERAQLIDSVVSLEATLEILQREAQEWRQRCLEAQSDRSAMAASENKAQSDLRDAHERERKLAASSVELRLHRTESDNTAALSDLEVRKYMTEVQRRDGMIHRRDEELDFARDELHRVRECSQEQDRLLRGREAELEMTKADLQRAKENSQRQTENMRFMEGELQSTKVQLRDAQKQGEERRVELERIEYEHAQAMERERLRCSQALRTEESHADGLRARIKELETMISKTSKQHADAIREAECFRTKSDHLDEVNHKLRLDIQESVGHGVRSGGVSFYHDSTGPYQRNPLSSTTHLSKGGLPLRTPQNSTTDLSRSLSLPRVASESERIGGLTRTSLSSLPSSPRQGRHSPLQRAHSPMSVFPSRLDYPRSSTARRLRNEVLSARTPSFSKLPDYG